MIVLQLPSENARVRHELARDAGPKNIGAARLSHVASVKVSVALLINKEDCLTACACLEAKAHCEYDDADHVRRRIAASQTRKKRQKCPRK